MSETSFQFESLIPTGFFFLSLNPYWSFVSPSITYMTIHDPSFVGGEEHWNSGSLDLERRFRLGSEVNGLSLSRSGSSEKNDPLDNLSLNFKLSSSMR